MSFYKDRLEKYFSDEVIPNTTNGRYISNHIPLENYSEITYIERNFYEETFGNFQIVIVSRTYRHVPLLDVNGKRDTYMRENEIAGVDPTATPEIVTVNQAFAYELNNPEHRCNYADETPSCSPELTYLGLCGDIVSTFWSTEFKDTLKKTKNKIKILEGLIANRTNLRSQADIRVNYDDIVEPFNVGVGDSVVIHAFGRFRLGTVIGTTGKRFHVGYGVYSNSDLRYKTVNFAQLKVLK